jgi:hypothetical protein
VKAIWINFIEPWPLRVRLMRYALLVCGVLMLGLVFLQYRQIEQAHTALAWQLQDMRGQTQSPVRLADETSDVDAQAMKHAQEILHQLNLPWPALFDTLESALANDVVILAVAPNPQRSALTLTAMAADSDAALDFADRLKASGRLDDIHLTQEEPWEENERFPLQFLLSADWNATP